MKHAVLSGVHFMSGNVACAEGALAADGTAGLAFLTTNTAAATAVPVSRPRATSVWWC